MTISMGKNAHEHVGCPRVRVGSKKSAQQGRSHFCALSVHQVREHGTMARTPLEAFFNRPLMEIGVYQARKRSMRAIACQPSERFLPDGQARDYGLRLCLGTVWKTTSGEEMTRVANN